MKSNIVQFKKKQTPISEMLYYTEFCVMEDGSFWHRFLKPEDTKWSEWIKSKDED